MYPLIKNPSVLIVMARSFPVPYFEYFDGADIHRYYLEQSEQMMEDIRNFLNS